MRRAARLAAALLALAGCTTEQGYLPIIATRPVDLDLRGVDVSHFPIKRGVEGNDTRATSVLMIPTRDGPSLARAVENALARSGGDVLTRAHVSLRQWWFVLASVETITVRGDSVDIPTVDQPPGTRLTAISTKDAPVIGFQVEGAPRVNGVEGKSLTQTYLWVPTRTMPPTLQEAIDEALTRGNGNLMTDAVVEHEWWYLPFIYGQEGWRVRGDVVRAK